MSVEIKNLTKKYKDITAVDGLSLSIGGAMQTLADPMENVVRRADLLMYQAKNHKDAVAVDTQDSRLAAQEQVLEEKPL